MDMDTTANPTYTLGPLLASGSCGRVYEGTRSTDGATVIIKAIIKTTDHIRNKIKRDSEIPQLINHPSIVKVLDVVQVGPETHIVYPHSPDNWCLASIPSQQLKLKKQPQTVSYLSTIIIQLCTAIQALHASNIIHRDIKPRNIIITEQSLFLIDFDLAHTEDNPLYPPLTGLVGTPNYLAPEVWLNAPDIDYKLTDIYALGVTAYYLFNRKHLPYDGKTTDVLEYQVLNTPPRQSKSGITPIDDLIMSIISHDPASRPSLDQIQTSLRGL
ncbi:Protein kinase [uncultured virus]|nr:Protein kinase [uncultured virus]